MKVVGTTALPVLYGGEFTPIPAQRLRALRREAWRAIKGGVAPDTRCSLEISFTLIVKGHSQGPAAKQDYLAVCMVERAAHLDERAKQEAPARAWIPKKSNGGAPRQGCNARPGKGRGALRD